MTANKKGISKYKAKQSRDRNTIDNTLYGSLFETFALASGVELENLDVIKYFKTAELPFIDDEECLEKLYNMYSDYFGIPVETAKKWPICLSYSCYNIIASPYIVSHYLDENGNDTGVEYIQPLPFRKDGSLTYSQTKAIENESVRIIDWD